MYDYTQIKDIAKQLQAQGHKYKVTDLIALAPQNDPFYVGTVTDNNNARWFAALWQQFGYAGNIHLRRVHYQIISQAEPVLMPDGAPYENTLQCWNFLEMASKTARYLELVDPRQFVDRRNPEPKIFTSQEVANPGIDIIGGIDDWSFRFPSFPSQPEYYVDGFNAVQRYHLEIWVEKSTMNDVLIPLCERYQVNLVTGVGEQSITSTLQLVQRAIDHQKPVRVLYVSDFDPAGRSMPVAVARKAEYYIRKLDPDLDFRLFPVALTQEQCQMYSLPRTPIKDTEKRKGHFEDQHGDGATELDALEALYPGTLADMLEKIVLNYYDDILSKRVYRAKAELEGALKEIQQEVVDGYGDRITRLTEEYRIIRDEFESRIETHKQQLMELWQAISRDMSERCPDIDDFPIPEAEEREDIDDGLFDSQRSYLEQLHVYKEFQGKSNGFDRATLDLLEV